MSFQIRKFITSNISAVASAHIAITAISIGYGTYAGKIREDDPNYQENSQLAKNFGPLTTLVTSMYSGKGVADIHGIRLGKTCTFEDPAAICSGAEEVVEAFRALSVAKPESVSLPRVVDVDPNVENLQVTYFLHQKYVGGLVVKSMLVVDAELEGGELVIRKIEERWNGVRPLGFFYYPSRRLNGIISFNMTKLFN